MLTMGNGLMLLKSLILITCLALTIATGAMLAGLHHDVSETGGSMLALIDYSIRTGDWTWVETKAMIGVGLIAGSIVGFGGFATVVVHRARRTKNERRGFNAEA
jgi:hypothetical protein